MFNIVLIWGPATDGDLVRLRDAIVECANRLPEELVLHVIQTREIETEEGVVRNRPVAAQQTYESEIAHMLSTADAVIALIGADTRPETSRGNVWTEWAFCVAVLSDHQLLTVIVSDEKVPEHGFATDFGHYGAGAQLISSADILRYGTSSIADALVQKALGLANLQVPQQEAIES